MCHPVSKQTPFKISQKGLQKEHKLQQQLLRKELKKIQPRTTTKTKKVSFYPKVVMKKVLHVNDYTNDEIENTWYTPYEMNYMMEDLEVTVYRFLMIEASHGVEEHVRKPDDDKFCRRGLESVMSKSAAEQKQLIKDNAYDAVLLEQKRQFNNNINHEYDLERIAQVYKQCTMESVQGARQLALQDQRDAI